MNFNWALLGLLNPFEEGSKKQRIVLIVALVGVLGGGCWWLADTGFGKASGLAETKYRIEMMGKALFWEYRANMGKTVAGEGGETFGGCIDKGEKADLRGDGEGGGGARGDSGARHVCLPGIPRQPSPSVLINRTIRVGGSLV